MTLRTKASLLIAVIITLSIVITGFFNLRLLEHSIRNSIYDGLESISGTTSQVISRFLNDTLKEAQAIALALPQEALEHQNVPIIEQKLKELHDIFTKFENGMFVLDAHGKLWADYPQHPETRGREFAFRQYFQETMKKGAGIVGTPYRSARTGMPVLTFTAVLRDRANQIIGMIGCSVQLNSPRALEGIRLTKIGETGYIYVYDSTRLMILHPREDRLLKKDVAKGVNKLFDAALEGFEGVGETVNSRGVPMLLSLKHIPETDWIIGAQQPQMEAFAPIQEARRQIFYSVVAAVLVAILIGAVAIRGITEPLLKLRNATILFGETGQSGPDDAEKKQRYRQELESIRDRSEIGGLAETFRQISQKLDRTIDSLKAAANDWTLTFNSVSDGIVIVDRENRVIRLNRSAIELFGIKEADALGRAFNDLIGFSPPSQPTDSVSVVEISGPNRFMLLEMSSTPLRDESGDPVGTVHVAKDITARSRAEGEKHQLEAQLQQAQRLESIGTLAGGIAHDFNNLLMSIQGNVSLLAIEIDPAHAAHKRLRHIEDSVQRGASLSRQLLGFARGGKYEVRLAQPNELIRRSLEMFGRTRKEIVIETRFREDLWMVEVDQGQIDQVLLNLYVNSWQAMPSGGTLTVQTENIHLDENFVAPYTVSPGAYVQISVSDTGVGMDEKTRERIFDPFFTTKEMGRGTGLGLASAYGIIKSHNGIIVVSSKPGRGATFHIYLPASNQGRIHVEGSLKEREAPLKGNETILLVDDEEIILDVGKTMLEKLGYTVLIARSGADAEQVYRSHAERIDLVILDMVMPGMGGGDTFDRLKMINAEIKILLSSGYSLDGKAGEIMERGCDGFIQKPFNLKQISSKIREILNGR